MEKPINQFYASVVANVLTSLTSGSEPVSEATVDGIRDRWLRNYQLITHDDLDLRYSDRERTEENHVEVSSNVLLIYLSYVELYIGRVRSSEAHHHDM